MHSLSDFKERIITRIIFTHTPESMSGFGASFFLYSQKLPVDYQYHDYNTEQGQRERDDM